MLLTNIYTGIFFLVLIGGFLFRKSCGDKITKVTDMGVCIAVGLIASTFFSTFPLTNTYTYTDSSVFIYIGKMMKEGYVPYRDLFDHKGIFLYFIQFLGTLFTPNSLTGLWLLETVNVISTVYVLYKIAGLFSNDRIVKWISLITVVVMCGMRVWEGGNFTEEYALPWISLTLYIFLKYFKNYKYCFKDIVWLGIGCAIVVLLRVNMIAIWAAVMPLILVRMIRKKEWKDLRTCAIGFTTGLCIVLIPVTAYFICTQSLKDFIDCYFVFNFVYSDGGIKSSNVLSAIVKGIKNQPYIIAAFILAIWPHIKKREYILNTWVLFFSLYFSYMSGRYYDHYGITLLPMFVAIVVCAINNMYNILSFNEKFSFRIKLPGNIIMISGLVLAVIGAFVVQYKWANLIRESMLQSGGVAEIVEYIEENSEKNDDVLIVGNDCKYYLLTDRKTNNKYFYQNSPIKASEEVYEGFISELNRCQSDLIIVMGNKEDNFKREDNRGKAYRYIESQMTENEYMTHISNDYYAYLKIQ